MRRHVFQQAANTLCQHIHQNTLPIPHTFSTTHTYQSAVLPLQLGVSRRQLQQTAEDVYGRLTTVYLAEVSAARASGVAEATREQLLALTKAMTELRYAYVYEYVLCLYIFMHIGICILYIRVCVHMHI